jgi:hypothetical protein
MATRNLKITLEHKGNGVFCATVDVPRQGVDRTDTVKWKVDQPEPPEFPARAVVAVDFPAAGDPLIDGVKGHHRGQRNGNDHQVEGRVGFVKDGGYSYTVSWVSELGVITPMMDPELVVEGGPGGVLDDPPELGGGSKGPGKNYGPPKRAAKKQKQAARKSAAAGRKKAAKKSARKTAGKKAKQVKKAKKARRSIKRKAKKR